MPGSHPSSSVPPCGLVPGAVGYLYDVLHRLLLFLGSLVDFYFAVLSDVFLAMDLWRYAMSFLSVCVLHRLHLGRFVPALVFRACFFLRILFSCGRTAHALFLLFSLFRVIDRRGSVLLRSVLTVLFVLAQLFLVCFFNITRFAIHIVAGRVV